MSVDRQKLARAAGTGDFCLWKPARLFDDPQQFDGVTELAGELDVGLGDVADAFDYKCASDAPRIRGQRSEDADFMHRIMAIDIERRLGFGITEALCFLSTPSIRALQFHAGQNVIAGAVDDAVEVRDAVAHKAFAQRFDDGNAARHAGFIVKIGSGLLGGGNNSSPWAERRALLAVMTGLPSFSAVK